MRMFAKVFLLPLAMLSGRWLQAQRDPTTPPTFRTNVQIVLVPITVTDHKGKTITGLRQQDFTILDNDRPQQILSLTSEDAPCSVGLVLDISGSMLEALGIAKSVTQMFFRIANPDDEFLLLTVSSRPAALPGFTSDVAALEKSIDSSMPGGRTALIDAVYLGLDRMREARRSRRSLLILSDGMDNYSRYSRNELMRVAVEADVQISTIIINGIASGSSSGAIPFTPALIKKPIQQGEERQGIERLEELADKTGGLHFRVHNGDQAREAATRSGQALHNQYVIGYRPTPSAAPGKWHRVHVKSRVAKLSIHARSGYYSP